MQVYACLVMAAAEQTLNEELSTPTNACTIPPLQLPFVCWEHEEGFTIGTHPHFRLKQRLVEKLPKCRSFHEFG